MVGAEKIYLYSGLPIYEPKKMSHAARFLCDIKLK